MCTISQINFGTFSEDNEDGQINHALDIIRFARLYKPGDGIISRMTRVRKEYDFEKIVIAYVENSNAQLVAIGCIVVDRKKAQPGWSTFSKDPSVPNIYTRINVWVKPKYRRKGIGKSLIEIAGVEEEIGVECYDTGLASQKLYGCLKKSRFF